MPTSVSALVSMPSSAEVTKSWIVSMSLVTRLMRSPVRCRVVLGQRQAMNVVIEHAPQVVHDPLADVGGEIVLQIGARGGATAMTATASTRH